MRGIVELKIYPVACHSSVRIRRGLSEPDCAPGGTCNVEVSLKMYSLHVQVPLKRFYRYNLSPELSFDDDG